MEIYVRFDEFQEFVNDIVKFTNSWEVYYWKGVEFVMFLALQPFVII